MIISRHLRRVRVSCEATCTAITEACSPPLPEVRRRARRCYTPQPPPWTLGSTASHTAGPQQGTDPGSRFRVTGLGFRVSDTSHRALGLIPHDFDSSDTAQFEATILQRVGRSAGGAANPSEERLGAACSCLGIKTVSRGRCAVAQRWWRRTLPSRYLSPRARSSPLRSAR